MANDQVILRFSDVTFEYSHNKHILDEAGFSLRSGSRITLMGQNGAGKSSLFKMITGELKPTSGGIFVTPKDASIAIARQVMPLEMLELSVRDYFAAAFNPVIPEVLSASEKLSGIHNQEMDPGHFSAKALKNSGMTPTGEFINKVPYNLDKLIKDVFEVVNVNLPLDRIVKKLSGGQQARLLLAHALIQNPDILLLDEPTNNLDQQGIEHLTGFLMMYEKTVLVISHDADFLNAFSDGVLYLDVFTHKIEQYNGNYYDAVEEIKNRIERENLQNARMQSEIKEKLAQAEVFAHKGGKLRAVAKRMREAAEEAEENIVDVRQEDKTIRGFTIPCQEFDKFFDGKILELNSVAAFKNHEVVKKDLNLVVRKGTHILISGPNGIGKSTMLEKLASSFAKASADKSGKDEGFIIAKHIKIGYYKQDFSNFNFEQKAYEALAEVMDKQDDHALRSTAAGFLLDGKLLDQPIAALSEGQKGLLSFCRLVLMKPGLLILDEPTNHINFRHLPVIAKALSQYQGASIMVSHIPDFVSQVRIDETIDLSSI